MDLFNIFIADTTWDFALEIIIRCIVMYLLIIIFLRLTGKRGIRQLSIFEIAIILSLGSAAGDPMFTEDVPLLHAFIVFSMILILYRLTTFVMVKSQKIENLLEGEALCVVQDGLLIQKDFQKQLYSQDEFFSEMRVQNIEHLGQVRVALLETDGSLSLLYYEDHEVKWGLPIFPMKYKQVTSVKDSTFYSCMVCGETTTLQTADQICTRCQHSSWAESLNNTRKS